MAINRTLVNWSRNIHVYLSIALLLVLIFFSVTGITLNHAGIMTASPEVSSITLESLPEFPRDEDNQIIASEQLEHFLRQEFGVRLALATMRYEDDFLIIDYQGPGRSTFIEIDQTFDEAFIERTNFGFVAALNDLHKGRNTDIVWSWLLDISALLLIVFSLAGFVLILPNKYRFKRVAMYTFIGTVILTAGYFLGNL